MNIQPAHSTLKKLPIQDKDKDSIVPIKLYNLFPIAEFSSNQNSQSEKKNKRIKLTKNYFFIGEKSSSPHLYIENPIYHFTGRISRKKVKKINKILAANPYEVLSLEEFKQTFEIYYFKVIHETISQQKINEPSLNKEKKEIYWLETIKKALNSSEFLFVKLIFINLRYYFYLSFKINEGNNSSDLFFQEINEIIKPIIDKDTEYFSLPSDISNLEFLIGAFKSVPFKLKPAISYILFGNLYNPLNNFISILEEWRDIPNDRFIRDIHDYQKNKIYQTEIPNSYRLDEKDIIRTYIPEDKILPKRLFINFLPLNLKQYSGKHKEVFFSFFSDFLKETKYLEQNEEELEAILKKFYIENNLPCHIKNLLGISAISCRFFGYKLLDEIHPKLRNNDKILYKENQGKVKIFYHINPHQTSCSLPLICTIYPKLPNPSGFAHPDKIRPLAHFSFLWTSYLDSSKNFTSGTLQLFKFNFIKTEKNFNATKKERKLIKKYLKLKKINKNEPEIQRQNDINSKIHQIYIKTH